mmetsp:Transcript_14078/g.21351  ORF Transcript_14078/g.21351 Transcript_14078/m.21351 type:complete len:577 (+) Transcript_14078:26-1756(+)
MKASPGIFYQKRWIYGTLGLYVIDGPLIIILAIISAFLGGLEIHTKERYWNFYYVFMHFFGVLYHMLTLRIYMPKSWEGLNFWLWTSVLTGMITVGTTVQQTHKWEGIERIVIIASLSVLVVLNLFLVPFYVFNKAHKVLPFKFTREYIPLLLLTLWGFGPIFTACTPRGYKDAAHTVVGGYGLFLIFGLMFCKPPYSDVHHIVSTIVVAFVTSWGHKFIVHVLLYAKTALGSKYEAIYGLLILYFFTSLGMFIAIELAEHLKHARMDSWHICFFSFQFFQEFAVSALFIDSGGLSWQFPILLTLVVLFDFITESGFLYEHYYTLFKSDQSPKSRALYLGRKYLLMKQKVFAEAFAAPSILAIVLFEYLISDRIGYSLVTRTKEKNGFVDDNFNAVSTVISYAILLVAEVSTGMINSHFFDQRLLRLRNEAIRSSNCFHSIKSVELKGNSTREVRSPRDRILDSRENKFQYNNDDNPSPAVRSTLEYDSKDNERVQREILNLPETPYTPRVANSTLVLPRQPSFADALPILNPLSSAPSFNEHLQRNRKHRLSFVVGAVLAVCITLRFFANATDNF